MLSSIAASLAISLLVLLDASDAPRATIPMGMMWVAFGGGVAVAILWASRWPTRRQSMVFGLVSNASIALACLAHPIPLAALIGCIGFAMTGAYFALFHTIGYVVYNFAVAASVGLAQAFRLGTSGHIALAGVDLFLVLEIIVALSLAIHLLVRALGVDLLGADRDPLTGLLNRRAFQHKSLGLVVTRRTADTHLMVALIDLDKFKELNDAHGHLAGDQALAVVAQTLRANSRDSAVIARSGGEEFLIADTLSAADPSAMAQRVCDAVAALPLLITASVGTASFPLGDLRATTPQVVIDELIAAADAAMYRAKRLGGNQIHHHGQRHRWTADEYLSDTG
jgi:diguanylate cyclase (GGDEF)-like protein